MDEQDSLAEIFGKNITRLRKMENMTQLELAEKLNYSDKAISKWEQGNSLPDVRVLVRLADLFGVTVDDLIREHKENTVVPKNTRIRSRFITVVCSVGICWLVAVCVFVLLGIFGEHLSFKWLPFLFAVPASAIVVLVFSCVWHWKWVRIISITVLIWTAITCVYFVAYALGAGSSIWLLFLIGIPLQVLALFFFVWRKKAGFREIHEKNT